MISTETQKIKGKEKKERLPTRPLLDLVVFIKTF